MTDWTGKEKEKVRQDKVKETVVKEKAKAKDMADLAADAEEEKDADVEKEEEKVKKEKESLLDKWVRKVTVEKESLVEKEKDLYALIAEEQATLPPSATRTQAKEKEKEKAFGTFKENMKIGIKKVAIGMKSGRTGTTMKANNSNSLTQQQASSSSQPNVRMVRQAQGNESIRRVMQESTVTIEEVEDEVVDLIGMFNNFVTRSNVRMVKEVKKRRRKWRQRTVRKECLRSINERAYCLKQNGALERNFSAEDMMRKRRREEQTC